MTRTELKRRIAELKTLVDDDERAHAHEDYLRGDVLQAIADGKVDDARYFAREVLTTSKIEFSRWCA